MRSPLPLCLCLFLPVTLLGDGKVFPPTAVPVNVTIPDQRALIHFTNGTERLVIETRFAGEGTNFAWVVPLPSQPVIEEASTGLFPTLQHLFRPRVIHNVSRYYLAILAVIGIVYLLWFMRPEKPLNFLDVIACLLVLPGAQAVKPFFGMALFVVLIIGVLWVRVLKQPADAVILVAVMVALVALVFFTPALSKSKAGMPPGEASSSSPAVSILDRRLVGVFETATIASRDAGALQSWLSENGYAVPTNAEPVIASYVKDGWVFVAAKVRRDRAGLEISTAHPLSFTFKTDKPVYPMRLTGVDNGALEVELYVFGPARAEARHFRVERCTRPAYPRLPPRDSWSWNWSRWSPVTPNIVHPLIREWVGGAAVATKLTATLSPAQMRRDVWLDWAPFGEKKSRRFSPAGALTTALNLGSSLLGCGLLAVCLFVAVNDRRRARLPRMAGAVALASLGLAGLVYIALPKTEVRLVRHPAGESLNALYYLHAYLEDTNVVVPADLRAEARRLLSNPTNDVEWNPHAPPRLREPNNNPFGGRIHEEDSPGNYVFRVRNADNRLEMVGYDAEGAEHVLGEWPVASPR
jgi:hypothetical protein